MAIDPVCEMTVDENAPAATSEYEGETYYFCASGCKAAFDEGPRKYLPALETFAALPAVPEQKARLTRRAIPGTSPRHEEAT